MKTQQTISNDPAVLAVLHRCGSGWRAVIATLRDRKPVIATSREFTGEELAGLDAWLDEHRAASVLCVLPAAAVICRTTSLPDAAPEQLAQALQLQAEAHLLGTAPPHRTAMAVLPGAAGETSRSGVILAWPESAAVPTPPTRRPLQFIPDIACLAALLNGQRPSEALMWLDRGDGSIALAVTHANGAVFRATNEEGESGETWERGVGRALAETALSVGHTGPFVQSLVESARHKARSLRQNDARLFVPEEIIRSASARLGGASSEQSWWSRFGIAAGAALARNGDLEPLSRMLLAPPVETPSRVRTVLERLSRPRAAVAVVLTMLAMLLFGPVVFAGLRYGVLSLRYSDVETQLQAAQKAKQQVALYDELGRQNVWPMTKILSDIITNAPLGIELEMVRIEGGKDFFIDGTAIAHDGRSPNEIVSLFQQNLQRDQLFTDTSVNWGGANNLGVYEFDLGGKVKLPYYTPSYEVERDFGKWTHAMRRDGDPPPDSTGTMLAVANGGPDSDFESDPETVSDVSSSNDSRTTGRTSRSASPQPSVAPSDTSTAVDDGALADAGDAGDSSDGRSASGIRRSLPAGGGSGANPIGPGPGAVASGREIPPPITTEQIEAMSREELLQHLTKISKARDVRGDEELKTRLKSEQDMIMARLRALRDAS